MGSAQVIEQWPEMTSAKVTFSSGHRVITIITNTAYIVAAWIDEVFQFYIPPACANGHVVVGLHIRPYAGGATAILQLCVGDQCLIYQLLHHDNTSPPLRLYEFLDDDRFCFTGIAVEHAVSTLWMEFGLTVRVWADLGDAAAWRLQREDLRWAGLDQLAREVMGFMTVRTNEVPWTVLLAPVPPVEHIPMACFDAVFSYELGWILLG